MRLLVIFACIFLAGCPKVQHTAKPAASIGGTEPVTTATTYANAAQTAADTAERERLAKVRANVDAAALLIPKAWAKLRAWLVVKLS